MNKIIQFSITTAVVFIMLFLTSCQSNKLDINTGDIEVKLDIRHFENDLFENKLNDYQSFSNKYPFFLTDYNKGIIGFPGNEQEAFQQLMLFKTDVNAKKVYGFVKEKFGNFKPYEDELTEAYKRFKYYFPEEKIPTIITYTSNFSFYVNPVGQDYIGIALDMHLGQDFKPYEYTNIEMYWRKILIPQTIVINHMMAHANDLFLKTNKAKNFTDEMVYYGKLLYFLDAVTPNVPDHIKIGMTQAEFDWCKKEEHNIWAFIVKEKYLFDTDKRRFERLLKEGPKTIASGIPPEAPAMIGRYVGWMAVRMYMDENNSVDLKSLMNNNNAELILQESGYKP